MPGDVFVDTSILVYAHDRDAGEKRDKCMRLVAGLWQGEPLPWVSVQVLQEFAVSMRRRGVPLSQIRQAIEDYAHWSLIENTLDLLREGLQEMKRWGLSLWDALILAAARKAGATQIFSEDLGTGQDYGGIRLVNPLGSGFAFPF